MLNVNLRNARSSLIEQILSFHDWVMMIVTSVSFLVLIRIWMVWVNISPYRKLKNNQFIELYWTLLPTVILTFVGIPSLHLLYIVDERVVASLSVKVVGHQWYWQYDYPDNSSYNSYLSKRDYRLLDVDHRLYTPVGRAVQLLITAADVLHSWTVPAIGIKSDAVPGRINKLVLLAKHAGIFYGQCREICGRNHRFMPITVESYDFNWLFTLKVYKNKS